MATKGPRTHLAARLVGAVAVAVAVAPAPACGLVVDADVEQCATDADCDQRGGALAGRQCVERLCRARVADAGSPFDATDGSSDSVFGCLGAVTWPPERPDQKIRFRQRFFRLLGGQPIVAMPVLACGLLDPECAQPIATGTTDAKGDVVVEIPVGFRGYLHMPQGGPNFPAMMPHLFAISPPPSADSDLATEPDPATVWSLVSESELNLLLGQVGAAVDPELGHINAAAEDCAGLPAAGVATRAAPSSSKTLRYFFQGSGTPSITAEKTDESGVFGFINVPRGVVDVETSVASSGRKHGHHALLVKKGTVTVADLPPTPN